MNRRTGNRWTGNRRTGNRRMRKRRTGLQKDNEGRKDKEQVNRKLSESFELGNRRTENIRAYTVTCAFILENGRKSRETVPRRDYVIF